MIQPVDDPIGQDFGANPTRNNPDPVFGDYQPDGHSGRDYKCWAGTPVRAVTSGTVLHIGRMGGTYADNPWWIQPSFAGYVAVIDHGAFIGIYGHCQDGSARVRKGDRVAEGQVFILSGNTGASTGDHLHFEILPDGYILNSRMYGRIDPAAIFRGITTQSETITPIEENDVGTVEGFTDQAMENLAVMVHTAIREQLKDVQKSVAFQEKFSVAMLEKIAAQSGVTIDTDAVAAEIRAKLAEQIGK